MGKTLGIIGGMGPLATVNLCDKIVMLTEAKCDQDHLQILIYNNSSIPDRTRYILGKGENPVEYLIESAKKLERMGADYLIMPCNTAHYFYNEIVQHIEIPFLNMIEETAKYIADNKNSKKVALLSTEGTIKAKVYDKVFDKYKIELVKPIQERQDYITKVIYDIKSGNTNIDLTEYDNLIRDFKSNGIERFILGCTELSTLYTISNFKGKYIDPLEIIAVRAIEYSGRKVRKDKLKTIKL